MPGDLVKEDTARTVANVVVGAAALGAAVVILRTPRLRRLAFGLARTVMVSGLPAWLAREVREAWTASDSRVSLPVDAPAGRAPEPPGDAFPAQAHPRGADPAEFSRENLDIPGVTSRPA